MVVTFECVQLTRLSEPHRLILKCVIYLNGHDLAEHNYYLTTPCDHVYYTKICNERATTGMIGCLRNTSECVVPYLVKTYLLCTEQGKH